MKYFEIYSHLLELMNRGAQYFSVNDVAEEIEDDDCDVFDASRILEEQGIVKSCGDFVYAFVGGVELMRDFIIKSRSVSTDNNYIAGSEKITLNDITGSTWSLVSKNSSDKEQSPQSCKSSFDDLFGDDDDDYDPPINRFFNFSERTSTMRQEQAKRRGQVIVSYLESMDSYDEKLSTFSPPLKICFPDETELVLRYVADKEQHFFTDRGCFKKYLRSVADNLPWSVSEEWIIREINNLCEDFCLINECGEIRKSISSANNGEDLSAEIACFVNAFTNYLYIFKKKYKDVSINEDEEKLIGNAIEDFCLKTYNANLHSYDESAEDCAIEAIKMLIFSTGRIKRHHAITAAEQLIELTRDDNSMGNLRVFEKMLEIFTSITDLQFRIFQSVTHLI